ncbi:MAG: OmpA family protein [Alteromonadaceae bacterium]|nr:OmpA family protein [Alteromonadaceae bacterium]MBL4911013.1 OmpA family protein [Alteromonadaceae bacterium]
MNRLRQRRHWVEHDNVDRWLVSYADYMTLLFALFVVLYAMAMVNEKKFESVTESFGRVFQADQKQPKERGHGDDILPVNTSQTDKRLYGDGILASAGTELVNAKPQLSNVDHNEVGTNLSSLEKKLNTALFDIIESGFAQLQIDGDWLEIELNSGLLFPSGSASSTNAAKSIINVIAGVIGKTNNYIRIRGYTDNKAIHNEVFTSNWQLSVARATSILTLLEALKLNPARMAIEGYGQYSAKTDNKSAQQRAKNRRVVIAISKYSLAKKALIAATLNKKTKKSDKTTTIAEPDNKIKVIHLKNGGLRITTRNDEAMKNSQSKNNLNKKEP